jgi:predicted nucleic acid-binding protein
MVLVDTSVWVEFLRGGIDELKRILAAGEAATHALVVEELALAGALRNKAVLELVDGLWHIEAAEPDEYLAFVHNYHIDGCGSGCVDTNLLLSCFNSGAKLWTLDKRLAKKAVELGCGMV